MFVQRFAGLLLRFGLWCGVDIVLGWRKRSGPEML